MFKLLSNNFFKDLSADTVAKLGNILPTSIFFPCCPTMFIQWCYILPETDNLNILVEEWSTRFNFVVEKHAPMREIRLSDKHCQWINSKSGRRLSPVIAEGLIKPGRST